MSRSLGLREDQQVRAELVIKIASLFIKHRLSVYVQKTQGASRKARAC
ncbi:hypothetical protein PS691_02943 [Pseudomonas fluorescens]|uniref:Uncharacterized protein n=1 Tax=Pseudomonas fluorescens TaxID=294 RepID=A0A5E7CJT0_PSEFL|nr:hypothetical protein PS691_02943 [Pseudomonas fluorescens]